ncbi:MAG: hypothetical protein AAGH67_06685 [Cyanobacteria bacterium P01_H01_bin.162]
MGISRTTLSDWHHRYRACGEVAAKQGYQQGHSHKISDWEAFRAFAAQHGNKTQAEMAQLWPEEISEDTMAWVGHSNGLALREKAVRPRVGFRR